MAHRKRGESVDGLLLVDKDSGVTSNFILQRAKFLLNAKKGGHTGTLDPIASGLLLLCFGETTKISELFLDADKNYEVKIKFGVATDSGDCDGKIISTGAINFSSAKLKSALNELQGRREQIPPMFSALKHRGQRLYKLARAGKTVARQPRAVKIYELQLQEFADGVLHINLSCSHGFYVRQFAIDLGEMLGCGAHVIALRRNQVGGLKIGCAHTLSVLENIATPELRREKLLSTEAALGDLPMITLPQNLSFYFSHGRSFHIASGVAASSGVTQSDSTTNNLVRVYSAEGFIGIGELDHGRLTAKRLFKNRS